MGTPALETRWGGQHPTHRALIVQPPHGDSDLVLRSEVIQQSFFSLQKHEYHYKAENGSDASGINCTMQVTWNGPQLNFWRLQPGPNAIMMTSWFSAQTMRTTASADVFANAKGGFSARSAPNERADAYVPWQKSIAKGVGTLLKEVIKKKIPIANVASLALSSGEALRISSEFQLVDQEFHYKLKFRNEGEKSVDVAGVSFGPHQVVAIMEAGEEREVELISSKPPVEHRVFFRLAGVCDFPIHVFIADDMVQQELEAKKAVAPVKEKKKEEEEQYATVE